MNPLAKLFLEQIQDEIFSRNALVQKCTFKYRFNPDYKEYPHKYQVEKWERKKQTSIADLVAEEIRGDYQKSIGQQISQVVQKIYKTYSAEMNQDGISENQLKGERGKKNEDGDSPWEIVYDWLWNKKYIRWLQDYIWNSWKEQAQTNSKWIQFVDFTPECASKASKGMKVAPPAPKEKLPIETSLNMEINIEHPGHYLLLFNRGQDSDGNITQYLIAPSQAFAPHYQLNQNSIIMPQPGAMNEDIEFDAIGKEEYIGIVIDNPLELSWLNPDPQNPAFEWEGQHLEQVWEQLQHQENWQIYYRDFEVVS